MNSVSLAPPMALLAELTHRCPLKCFYCSNPLELVRSSGEIGTETWLRVLEEAAAIGILQVHFSGGEPMVRKDLPILVRHAASLQLYSNLITSGVLLTDQAMATLLEAGIDHIQLSFQDSDRTSAEFIGGYRGAHAKKFSAAKRIIDAGLPLTTNFVIHRLNVDRVEAMIALGAELGSSRIEIAHTQYYGWGLRNRDGLLPTREQLDRTTEVVEKARARLKGVLTIDYVIPDYYAVRPKACMGGWGNRFMNISPTGKVLPCHAAETLPNINLPSVHDYSIGDIWTMSEAFQKFRGTDWMPDPCRSCDRREIDWGGCRCQAFALTGRAEVADPICEKSPDHALLAGLVKQASVDAPLTARG